MRRTAIICQLPQKANTDADMLLDFCRRRMHETEFFRKTIGWALREYGKTEPDTDRDFVAANETELSGLSRREAPKNLK